MLCLPKPLCTSHGINSLVTWQQRLGILFLTITALFLSLILFDDGYLLGTIIYLQGQELQTFLHQDNLQVGCLGR